MHEILFGKYYCTICFELESIQIVSNANVPAPRLLEDVKEDTVKTTYYGLCVPIFSNYLLHGIGEDAG